MALVLVLVEVEKKERRGYVEREQKYDLMWKAQSRGSRDRLKEASRGSGVGQSASSY